MSSLTHFAKTSSLLSWCLKRDHVFVPQGHSRLNKLVFMKSQSLCDAETWNMDSTVGVTMWRANTNFQFEIYLVTNMKRRGNQRLIGTTITDRTWQHGARCEMRGDGNPPASWRNALKSFTLEQCLWGGFPPPPKYTRTISSGSLRLVQHLCSSSPRWQTCTAVWLSTSRGGSAGSGGAVLVIRGTGDEICQHGFHDDIVHLRKTPRTLQNVQTFS